MTDLAALKVIVDSAWSASARQTHEAIIDAVRELRIRADNAHANAGGDPECRAAGLEAGYLAAIDLLFEIVTQPGAASPEREP